MQEILSEKNYILRAWKKHPARSEKLAIYGLGKNTEIILENFDCSNVVGLLDGTRTDGELFGKQIITIDKVFKLGAQAIIIIGRAANVRVIHRRIADFCSKNNIDVYDINGDRPGVEAETLTCPKKYEGIAKNALIEKINKADIVSFDIFDTLVMRKTLYPHDIFKLSERKFGEGFVEKRIEAELSFYRDGKHPTIYDIYNCLDGCTPDLELEIEQKNLVARKSMVSMLEYAVNLGKSVYLVSDMYLTSDIIMKFLKELGIDFDKNRLLVSCEHQNSKSDGLFSVLKEKAGKGTILHIGDNFEADILAAVHYGIDDTFQLEGAITMLEDSFAKKLLDYDNSLENRLLIGRFISEQLNDPFLFSVTGGKFAIETNYLMAHSFVAPMILCLISWLSKEANRLDCERILLASRDGYIIEKIYALLLAKGFNLPHMQYFYTSRIVAVVAGLKDDEDILHAARLAFNGTAADMLKERFGLDDAETLKQNGLLDSGYILAHKEAILRNAQTVRTDYLNYIQTLEISNDAKVGFFDFVSSGTCQKGLANFVDFDVVGLYLAAINYETEYKNSTDIQAMYGVLNVFRKTYEIMENYITLESIMTSPEPTLCGFSQGTPLFLPESRSSKQLDDLEIIHNAILDYADNISEHFEMLASVDKRVPDLLLSYISSGYSNLSCTWFDEGKLDDEFCKRSFGIATN